VLSPPLLQNGTRWPRATNKGSHGSCHGTVTFSLHPANVFSLLTLPLHSPSPSLRSRSFRLLILYISYFSSLPVPPSLRLFSYLIFLLLSLIHLIFLLHFFSTPSFSPSSTYSRPPPLPNPNPLSPFLLPPFTSPLLSNPSPHPSSPLFLLFSFIPLLIPSPLSLLSFYFYSSYCFSVGSRDSSVGIATGYGLDDRGVGIRVPVESRIFSPSQRPYRLWGPPSLLSKGYRGLFPSGVKRPGSKADHSLPTNAEVLKMWIYT
jgi:hypothetical protein